MPYDSARVKARERLGYPTAAIGEILQEPWMKAGREGLSPAQIITKIFGLDIRAGSPLNDLSDADIEDLIPKAEACLRTLQVLREYGMFPPKGPWTSFSKEI